MNTCGIPNFQTPGHDPRIAELRAMRLPAAWVMVAETVGFDTFLTLWRKISADPSLLHDGGQRLPKLRSFDAWKRHERDRYIIELSRQGKSPAEVTRAVARNWREHLNEKHVAKIMRSARKTMQ